MIVKAPAKVNLNLHVLPDKDAGGLYPIKFVNCQVSLADQISLKRQDRKIEVSCRYKDICSCDNNDQCRGQKNLIIKAAELLKTNYGKLGLGAKIFVDKSIPPSVGLAGGSADAAAVLKALSRLWQLNLGEKSLLKIACNLGMDVQYCLVGGLCLVEGRRGEKITKIKNSLSETSLLIITPEAEKPSTEWAYKNLRPAAIGKKTAKIKKLLTAIKLGNLKKIGEFLHNDFEDLIIEYYPVVRKIKNDLLESGACGASLTGSGLAVYGLFETEKLAKAVYNRLRLRYPNIYQVKIV